MIAFPYPPEFSANLVSLRSPAGGRVILSPYGAHVLSWVTPEGGERLFLSPKAEFRPGAAIRGGVPLIFPQFGGLGSLPKHGFARSQTWQTASAGVDSAVFQLADSEATRAVWPQHFLAEYSVRVRDERLEMSLSVTNTGQEPFSFTAALHTYLRVQSLDRTAVVGLAGLHYLDSASGGQDQLEEAGQVTFPGEVDRIYRSTPVWLRLVEPGRELRIGSEGFPDTVVWNPGAQKCALLADMEPDGYLRFVCVESAAAANPAHLAPGASWRGAQILAVGG